MTLKEAIEQRHSVRKYIHKPLTDEVVDALQKKIEKLGANSKQITFNKTNFSSTACY